MAHTTPPVRLSNITALVRLSNITALLPSIQNLLEINRKLYGTYRKAPVHKQIFWMRRRRATWAYCTCSAPPLRAQSTSAWRRWAYSPTRCSSPTMSPVIRWALTHRMQCFGSGSADPYFWLMDTDPAVFVSDLEDDNKKFMFLCFLLFTLLRYIYIIF